jgi:hypothetical protein
MSALLLMYEIAENEKIRDGHYYDTSDRFRKPSCVLLEGDWIGRPTGLAVQSSRVKCINYIIYDSL